MGGTRCIFRSCKKSQSNTTDLHFFHFPIKKKELMNQWVKMAKTEFLLQVPMKEQRNKSVCMLHFRDECFMNYKKNRLVPDAVPTLDRLLNGMVFDYTKGENPTPCILSPTKQPHLIPPEGYYQPTYATVTEINLPATIRKRSLNPEEENKDKKKYRLSENPKILNNFNCLKSKSLKEIKNDNEREDTVEIIEFDSKNSTFMEKISEIKNSLKEISVEYQAEKKISGNLSKLFTMIVNLEKHFKESELKNEIAKKRAEKAEELVKKLMEEKNKMEQQVSSSCTSKEQQPLKMPIASAQLNKAQLFNAVKKYLSSSMTTFLRMEMFGNAERKWKPDEKEISMDIYRLGENIYKHLIDEWRFRLPSETLVKKWFQEPHDTVSDNEYNL